MIKIDHIALYTRRLEVCRAFYETYFGATAGTMYHNPNTGLKTYFLSFTGDTRLEIMERPDVGERPDKALSEGLIHLAFSTGSREAVDRLTARLVADGYACVGRPRITGDGYYESVVTDPDGNRIEITI